MTEATYRASIMNGSNLTVLGTGLTRQKADDLLLQNLKWELDGATDRELMRAGYTPSRPSILRSKTDWLERHQSVGVAGFRYMHRYYSREVDVPQSPEPKPPFESSMLDACRTYVEAVQRIKDTHRATTEAKEAYDAARAAEQAAVDAECKAFDAVAKHTKENND